jgi:hypothetical protein
MAQKTSFTPVDKYAPDRREAEWLDLETLVHCLSPDQAMVQASPSHSLNRLSCRSSSAGSCFIFSRV